jgi:hypothetical protein
MQAENNKKYDEKQVVFQNACRAYWQFALAKKLLDFLKRLMYFSLRLRQNFRINHRGDQKL